MSSTNTTGTPSPRDAMLDAVEEWDAEAVRRLLAEGVNVTGPDGFGGELLHAVCFDLDPGDAHARIGPDGERGDVAIIRLLVAAGVDVNSRDEGGSTPLHTAVGGDGANVPAAHALLVLGADVNARDNNGITPLMDAASWWRGRAVALLLEFGADPMLRAKDGRSASDVATPGAEDRGRDAELLERLSIADAAAEADRAAADLCRSEMGGMFGNGSPSLTTSEWAYLTLCSAGQAAGAWLLWTWGMPVAAVIWGVMIPVNIWLTAAFRRVMRQPIMPATPMGFVMATVGSLLMFAGLLWLHYLGVGWVVWVLMALYLGMGLLMLRWLVRARQDLERTTGGAHA